jgi:SAM-dependent methyltransferase
MVSQKPAAARGAAFAGCVRIAYKRAMQDADDRRHSPAAERNGPPILAELARLLPARGTMLEIASGTGQHAALFAAALPGWTWQPTDFDDHALPSIRAWCAGIERVRAPLQLDVLAPRWPDALPASVDAIFCANMIHIAPWACTGALMRGATRLLAPQGLLLTYGPYLEDDVPTAAGNLAFDADLRARNPEWGIRRLADVRDAAHAAGLALRERVPMPANHLLLAWSRTAPGPQA